MPSQELLEDAPAGDHHPSGSRPSRRWLMVGGICLVAVVAIGVAVWLRPEPAVQRDPEQDRQSARHLVAVWDAAITSDAAQPGATRPVLINSALQGRGGEGETDPDANMKLATEYNAFVASAAVDALPSPSSGEIHWQDGVSRTVPVIDAGAAAAALAESPNKNGVNGCDGCTPLELTDPRLGTAEAQTPFGPAVVPEWSFAVQGSSARITQVAVDPAAMMTVPGLEYGTVQIDLGENVNVAGNTVTVNFTGGPPADTGPCGMEYTAELIESRHTVAVLINSIPNDSSDDLACSAAGFSRTVTVTSSTPVDDRVLINLAGMALPRS